jgi:hypothetical protein
MRTVAVILKLQLGTVEVEGPGVLQAVFLYGFSGSARVL